MADDSEAGPSITATYHETEHERQVRYEIGSKTAVVAQPRSGYAMVTVRRTPDGDELERYYGFDMALDHVAELLGVHPATVPIPEAAEDFGI